MSDTLASIMSWLYWEEMLDMAHFVGVTRPGYPLTRDMVPEGQRDNIELIDIPAMAISSTDCRERARGGEPVWYLVPRSEEHTSELQSRGHLVCRLLLDKKKTKRNIPLINNNRNHVTTWFT